MEAWLGREAAGGSARRLYSLPGGNGEEESHGLASRSSSGGDRRATWWSSEHTMPAGSGKGATVWAC